MPASAKRFRLVILDLDGTLYSSRSYVEELGRAVVRVAAEMLGTGLEEAERRLSMAKERSITTSAALGLLGLDRREFYERLAALVEPSKHIGPSVGLEERVRRLKGLGLRVALHTNAGRSLASKVLAALGLQPDLFDYIVTSEDAEPKPSPGGYERLVSVAGCRPEQCIYIGDRALAELRTAKMMGMLTVKVGGRPSIWADIHASSIFEALSVVERAVRNAPPKGAERDSN
jgi:putative hydrolase of the HAD superfamily